VCGGGRGEGRAVSDPRDSLRGRRGEPQRLADHAAREIAVGERKDETGLRCRRGNGVEAGGVAFQRGGERRVGGSPISVMKGASAARMTNVPDMVQAASCVNPFIIASFGLVACPSARFVF
jgi:hypothetical protein